MNEIVSSTHVFNDQYTFRKVGRVEEEVGRGYVVDGGVEEGG